MIAPSPGSVGPEIEVELPSEPTSVGRARHALAELAARVGAPVDDVRIAISEAVGNAVIHAFRGREPGTIRLRAWLEPGRLVAVVSDDGQGMSANLDSPGLGLGISLITRVAAEARFESSGRGTTVHMVFQAEGAG